MKAPGPLGQLRATAAEYCLDLIGPDIVIARAAALISSMPSSASLIELAAAEPHREDVANGLRATLEEQGSHMPGRAESGVLVTLEICQMIIDERMTPIAGARMIWWKVAGLVPELAQDLRLFVGLASEWEDDDAHRAEYEDQIIDLAAETLRQPPNWQDEGA